MRKPFYKTIYFSSMCMYILLVLFLICIMLDPQKSITAASKGIALCAGVIMPSLFPFFVCTELLVTLGFVHIPEALLKPVMKPLFNVPGSGAFAFCMGIISGYPVGAKMTVDLKQKNLCSKTEGERLLTFCNNSGPLFVLGAVGERMLGNRLLGYMLFAAHILASLTVGFLFRFYKSTRTSHAFSDSGRARSSLRASFSSMLFKIKNARKCDQRGMGELLSDAVKNSISLLFTISGFIVFFSVIIEVLNLFGIIKMMGSIASFIFMPLGLSNVAAFLAEGFFEITTGINSIAASDYPKLTGIAMLLGWGGLSVHFQVISIISKSDMSILPYIAGKSLHALLSGIYTIIIVTVFRPASGVFMGTRTDISIIPTNAPEMTESIIHCFSSSLLYIGVAILILTGLCIIAAAAKLKK